MAVVVLVLSLGSLLPALAYGVPRVRAVAERRDPHLLSDVVAQAVRSLLRLGVLLLLLAVAAIAVIGSIAALRGGVGLPGGVALAGFGTVVLAALTLLTFGRTKANQPVSRSR